MGWFKGSSSKSRKDRSRDSSSNGTMNTEDMDRAIALSMMDYGEEDLQNIDNIRENGNHGSVIEEDEQFARALQESLCIDSYNKPQELKNTRKTQEISSNSNNNNNNGANFEEDEELVRALHESMLTAGSSSGANKNIFSFFDGISFDGDSTSNDMETFFRRIFGEPDYHSKSYDDDNVEDSGSILVPNQWDSDSDSNPDPDPDPDSDSDSDSVPPRGPPQGPWRGPPRGPIIDDQGYGSGSRPRSNSGQACEVCGEDGGYYGKGVLMNDYWGQKYCPSHDHDGTSRCYSCLRLETIELQHVELDDGRSLCLECLNSSVMDDKQCQPLLADILDFYEGLHMPIKVTFPFHLVDRQTMNNVVSDETSGPGRECRGVCMSKPHEIPVISEGPKFSGKRRIRDKTFTQKKLVPKSEVTGILVLYGYPRLLTGAILAHETMHAWMRLNGYKSNNLALEEGVCQVLGHMWLESEIASGTASRSSKRDSFSTQLEKKLGKFFKHQIETSPDPVYGDGFRAAYRAVGKYGLENTLKHIWAAERLPE